MAGSVSRVAKEKAKPRKAPSSKNEVTMADENLLCVWLCMKHNGGGSVDFQAVSAKMGTTVAAAKSRLNRVKDRMEFLMKSKEAIKNAKPGPASPSKPAEQDKEEEPKPEKSYIDELAEDL